MLVVAGAVDVVKVVDVEVDVKVVDVEVVDVVGIEVVVVTKVVIICI